MKGISAIIATILMLVIAISLAGLSFMYFQGIFTQQTGRIIGIDEGATFCNTTGIYLYVKNLGTQDFNAGNVRVGMQGGSLQTCNKSTATESDVKLVAGGSAVLCDNYIAGSRAGFNTIIVTGGLGLSPTNTLRISVSC